MPTHGIVGLRGHLDCRLFPWMRLRSATSKLAMKDHYLHSRFANRMIRVRQPLAPLGARRASRPHRFMCQTQFRVLGPMCDPGALFAAGTLLKWGVWLGRHTFYRTTQVSRSTTQAGRKPLIEEQVKGTADEVTFSKSPQCGTSL